MFFLGQKHSLGSVHLDRAHIIKIVGDKTKTETDYCSRVYDAYWFAKKQRENN